PRYAATMPGTPRLLRSLQEDRRVSSRRRHPAPTRGRKTTPYRRSRFVAFIGRFEGKMETSADKSNMHGARDKEPIRRSAFVYRTRLVRRFRKSIRTNCVRLFGFAKYALPRVIA